MQNALACAARLFALLEEDEESADAPGTLGDVEGRVDIDGVAFSYDKSRSLIEDFNLNVAPGMRIAVVGPTGCGKTTFINLLMRFYDTDAGSISVDGKDKVALAPRAALGLRHGFAGHVDKAGDGAREHRLRQAGRHG